MNWLCRGFRTHRQAAGKAAPVALLAIGAVLSPVRPAAAAAQPAPAAGRGWRIALSRHFGPAASQNGFDAVIGHRQDAWFFGGTNLGGPGGSPLIEHRVNGTWHRARLPGGLPGWIAAASSASPRSVWAVSHAGGYVLNWNSVGWQQVPSGGWAAGTRFTGIDAITRKNVWVFGAGGGQLPGAGTWHLTYSVGLATWTRVGGIAGDIYQASNASPTSIWAIGGIGGNQNAVLHLIGTTWRHVTGPALAGMQFSFVLAQAADSVWLSGSVRQHGRVQPKLAHWNGSRWVRIAVPAGPAPTSLAPDGAGGIWVVANSAENPAAVLHRSATGQWSRYPVGASPDDKIIALAAVPATKAIWGGGVAKGRSGSNAAVYAGP